MEVAAAAKLVRKQDLEDTETLELLKVRFNCLFTVCVINNLMDKIKYLTDMQLRYMDVVFCLFTSKQHWRVFSVLLSVFLSLMGHFYKCMSGDVSSLT